MPLARRRPDTADQLGISVPGRSAAQDPDVDDSVPPPAPGSQVATRNPDSTRPAIPEGPAVIPAALLEKIEQAVSTIPEADGEGGWDMLSQLFAATDADDLNRPWQGTSGRTLAGRRLLIKSVTRRPSSFDGGPEIFLVVRSVDTATGEDITWTSSALAVVVQLAVAYQRGWYPLIADVVAAPKPTARGFTPYHLNVTRLRAEVR